MKKLSKRERNIVVVVAAVILLFMADRYLWSPYMASREEGQADLAAARAKQSKIIHLIKDDKANRLKFDKMIADGLKMDASEAESQMLHAFDDWARDSRLNLPSIKRERMEQDKVFGRIVFRASGAGTMAAISRFLWDVQTAKIPTRIVDLQISGRQGAKEGTDDLTMTVAISTLVRGRVPTTAAASSAVAAISGGGR
ncbi:MAG TPA: hypothetical protein VFE58_00460 [Tepidisphaeraceae bacterium]|jgi:hypothetical protein|nr:hypothetical protein [Tepidisphaeraceae bacterium]